MPDSELRALLFLDRIEGIGLAGARLLYSQFGSASEILRHLKEIKDIIPGAEQGLNKALNDSGYDVSVSNELEFIRKHNIRCVTIGDDDYPSRLLDCNDAPLFLFSMGNVNLNAKRIVGVVGTRKATGYGLRMCRTFVSELGQLCPDVVIISGLASGIDVEAHRQAIASGMSTYGVLAHGLDRIYPAANRGTACGMLQSGGLITEFQTGTVPIKSNFVRRNRIIAGLSDAVVVVESAAKGGSLLTAEMAESYNRECFAFPGSVGDPYSVGCNELIRDNRAGLICSALDFVTAMGWDSVSRSCSSNDKQLFPQLTELEAKVFGRIMQKAHGVHINTLIVELNVPYQKLVTVMFSLEMKGLAEMTAGSICRIQ